MAEPTAQLAPRLVNAMFDKIIALRDEHDMTVVLVEQDIRRALSIGDRAYALRSGTLSFQGKAEDLLKHEKFEEICMGID